jgi:ABC-type oligopeptide transport system substrate-binding subunit
MKIKAVMKLKSISLSATVFAACTLLQACGGGSHSSTPATPPPVTQGPMTLDTTQVLAAAQVTSESDDPIAVNDGLVTVAGATDDTSDPAPAP